MKELFTVVDDFCPEIEHVRNSALESGFNTLTPKSTLVGSGVYEGMNFVGRHSFMLRALAVAINQAPFPNSMFFRVTNEDTEAAYTHSDRDAGNKTCIAYMSEHKEVSGTGFFRHRETGLTAMPTIDQMKAEGIFDLISKDAVSGGEKEWEQIDFVRGLYNRALIFDAPLFHARCPRQGFGSTAEAGRMVWVCHYNLLTNGGGF